MQKRHIILIHTVFWLTTLLLVGLETIPSIGKLSNDVIVIDYLLYVISFFAIFYSFYFSIKIEHLKKKKIKTLILYGLLFIIIITFSITYIYVISLAKEVFDLKGKASVLEFGKYYMSFLETNFLYAISGSLMKTALLWYKSVMKQKEIEKQLVMNELAMLKSQINPNFLFNTLTNIRSLIETQTEKAIYSIEILSDIMSYMLYDSSKEKVFLEDEIDNINNYLNLQRVRYNPDFISFDVTEDTKGLKVPPLIFMPFIEDVFIRGDISNRIPGIKIALKVVNNLLSFEVMSYTKENSGGGINSLNLKNIKRRLYLLFGDKYTLEIKNADSKNIIKLGIIL